MQELSYEQKKQLRNLYGEYKELNPSEYESRQDYLADRTEIWNEILAICPELTKDNIQSIIYSKRQQKFIDNFLGFDGFRWDYGGRFMYGDKCPAIVLSRPSQKEMNKWEHDSMMGDTVLYAKD